MDNTIGQNDSTPAQGSSRKVEDYSSFCAGDIESSLNKRIQSLISCDKNYIVYLDDKNGVQWSWNDAYGDDPPDFAEVASKIGLLETLSATQLTGKQNELLERILAEGMARIVGEKDQSKATETLEKAEAYLRTRGGENARIWYLTGCSVMAFLTMVIGCLLWLFRGPLTPTVGNGALEVLIGACLGCLGAFLSVLYRSTKILVEPAAGRKIHYVEGAARGLAGSLGALLIAFAVKANLVLGIIKSNAYALPALLLICFIAGWSEKLVPSFIGRVEVSVSKTPS